MPQNSFSLQIRARNIINVFRLTLSLIFIVTFILVGENNWWDNDHVALFFNLSIAYFIFGLTVLIITPLKPATFAFILPIQIVIDIIFIVLLMFAAGGIQSGFGLFLIITIVTASLVSNGRLALFYASIASIGLLLEQSYQIIQWNLAPSTYTQPVMLALSCFATAWLAYSLAKRTQHSEDLASARGIDLENLAQVNALITQEMHDGVIVVDKHLNIRHHNLQTASLLSLPENTFPQNNSEIRNLADLAPEIARELDIWITGKEANSNLVIEASKRELKLRFKPINRLRNLGAVIFIQDWSHIQSAAQQAKLAALGRLTANIAHEIRNPLSAISHANQLLQEEKVSKTTERILQIIADNIGRIDQIIKDVLELNRRDRTQQELIELSQFLRDFYAQFCAVEKVPNSHFLLNGCSKKQIIYFDQRHLTQILWNLCKNGWEHSQKNLKSLSLSCTISNNTTLSIEIKDDGDGVAEADMSRLFEPFFTTKSTGNGLGLYISRELAEANSASLQYQAVSKGGAFMLQIKKSG